MSPWSSFSISRKPGLSRPWSPRLRKPRLEKADRPRPAEGTKAKSMAGTAENPAEKPSAKEAAAEQAARPRGPDRRDPQGKAAAHRHKTTAVAQVQPLAKSIRTVGLVEYDQRRLNTINTKIEGWIEKLYVNFTGTYVKKGEPVADIYSPELVGHPAGVHQHGAMGQERQGEEGRPGRRPRTPPATGRISDP